MIRFASQIIPTLPLTLQDTISLPILQTPRNCPTKEDGTANLPAGIRKGTPSATPAQIDCSSRVPGLKFGFTGNQVAITFGPNTIDTTLIAYRIDGQDWQLTNVSTVATHLLVSSNTTSVSLNYSITPSTFEMRVTNWAYGVQISAVHVGQGEKLVKVADFPRTLELIGDSLTAGQYATLEGLSSYGYVLGAGLGNTEYSVTAYPGICLFDKNSAGETLTECFTNGFEPLIPAREPHSFMLIIQNGGISRRNRLQTLLSSILGRMTIILQTT
jgi:hypothetical protein